MVSSRLARLVLGGLVPLTVICMAVVPPLVLWGHLPDPLASHFGFSGTPNGFMGRSTAFAGTWALAVLPSVWVTVSVLRSKRPSRAGGLVALVVLIGATGVAASIDLVVANLNAPGWRDAHNPVFGLVLLLGLPFVFAGLVYALARCLDRSTGSGGRAQQGCWARTRRDGVRGLPPMTEQTDRY
ncbi:MAG: DUF1648 domain-containing protein [Acidimicrobiales bacterium]